MSTLKSLTFAALPKGGSSDPTTHRRNKLIDRLRQQIELAKDPTFTLTRQKWVADATGVKQLVQQPKRCRPWWKQDAAGNFVFAVLYGAQKIEFEKGKAAILVGKREKLIPTIEAVIEAVSNSELDTVLATMSKTAIQSKGGKRAA